MLFTTALARRPQGSGVTANVLHPGLGRILFPLIDPFLLTPEKGAEIAVYLASSPEAEGGSGKYFANKKAFLPIQFPTMWTCRSDYGRSARNSPGSMQRRDFGLCGVLDLTARRGGSQMFLAGYRP